MNTRLKRFPRKKYKKQNPDEKGYVGVRSKKGVDHMLVLKVPARHSLTYM